MQYCLHFLKKSLETLVGFAQCLPGEIHVDV